MSITSRAKWSMGFGVRSPKKSKWVSLAPESLPLWQDGGPFWAGENPFCSHPFCSNVWFSIPDFRCQPWDHGARRDGDYGTCHHKKDKRTGNKGGHPDCLRKRSKPTQLRWALGVRLDSSSGVFLVQHSPFSGVVTLRSREGKGFAHVIQDILEQNSWLGL